jgi:pSer/pThr/pTyr-binding forkhead associated (FHA) protein
MYTPPSQPYQQPPLGGGSPPFTGLGGGASYPSPGSSGPAPVPVGHSGAGSAPLTPVATRACPNCGTEVPSTFMFCGACGTRLEGPGGGPVPHLGTRSTGDIAAPRQAVAPIAEPKPHGRLTLIRPDGSEGGTHELEEGENQIGRQHGALFENDGYLSPRHAEIVINAAGAVIRDVGSLNGVFAKMTSEEELSGGDVFRIGQELLRFDTVPAPQPLEDGTEVMGSPNPGYWGRLSVIIGKDIDGSAYPLYGDAVTIGRERGDINFPDDGYVSGLHARVSFRDGKALVADLGSSNGTFMRLRGERVVQDGAFILFGQQLFRINLSMI